jgi:thiamine-phosphate pyrophosphorylase
MTTSQLSPELYRVIDANLNRLKEGVRVVEDIIRYRDNNKAIATQLKNLRHKAKIEDIDSLLLHRDSINDVLRPTISSELNRSDIRCILIANF